MVLNEVVIEIYHDLYFFIFHFLSMLCFEFEIK
nr:MAG TPA: hypothetical protein [Bacteriophage sp.]